MESKAERNVGFFGAVGIGVGAIVGGGILALTGAAFASTGPSAILAFALNGVIALITALSFAELSAAFPESGGTYVFSKKVLSIRAAFAVGWVVWFASIVAAVLYAADQAAHGDIKIKVEKSDDIAGHIISRVAESDLVILGTQRLGRRRKSLGELILRIARETDCPILMISRRN